MAELYDVHVNTVRNWLRDGLQPIDRRHETLVNGRYLNAFHAHRKQSAKRPCGPTEFYCFKCHEPHEPVVGLIDVVATRGAGSKVEMLCSGCGGLNRRWVRKERLERFLALQSQSDVPHLSEGAVARSSCESAVSSPLEKLNAENERIKHRYFDYLKEARQLDVKTIDAVARALDRFEVSTKRKSFKEFRPHQAKAFKRLLDSGKGTKSGERIARGTAYPILKALKDFFFWLPGQPGYKSQLRYDWSDYFNMSLKDVEVAKARREPRVPTLDQIRSAIFAITPGTIIDRRDRALLACAIITGARDNALASLRLKHIDLIEKTLVQDGREVRTKFAKSFPTYFFEVGEDIETVLFDWIHELQSLGYVADDPVFPATKRTFSDTGVPGPSTLSHACWSDSHQIRGIFRRAFAAAGLAYFNPHSFRKTLTRLGMERCAGDVVALKAWSQNLGHEEVLTTLTSYGGVPFHQQRDLIRLADGRKSDDDEALRIGREILKLARPK